MSYPETKRNLPKRRGYAKINSEKEEKLLKTSRDRRIYEKTEKN